MMRLDTWVEQMSGWYETRKHDQEQTLESLLLNVPDSVWGPEITELQSKAIACWLDGCLRIYQHQHFQQPNKAYQFLQYAYSKLQLVVSSPESDIELKDWCMKRLQHLAVLTLEFCNQQTNERWQEASHQMIESHIHFMAAQCWNEARKDDQGHSTVH